MKLIKKNEPKMKCIIQEIFVSIGVSSRVEYLDFKDKKKKKKVFMTCDCQEIFTVG